MPVFTRLTQQDKQTLLLFLRMRNKLWNLRLQQTFAETSLSLSSVIESDLDSNNRDHFLMFSLLSKIKSHEYARAVHVPPLLAFVERRVTRLANDLNIS